MKPYQPSHQVPSAGFQWMLWSAIGGGSAIGGITHLIALFVYLVVLFPIMMGLAGGVVMIGAIQRGKVRNPAIATLFGALTGIVIYGSLNAAGYMQFKQSAAQQITQELGPSGGNTDALIDEFLQTKTGDRGFIGYVKHNAQEGVSIGRVGSRGSNLGETGTWIYWLIEFAIIDIMIAVMAYGAASAPFCESCRTWYKDKERLGNVNAKSSENFLTLLNSDHFSQAGALVEPLQGISPNSLEVSQQSCPGCKLADRILTVSAIAIDQKGHTNVKEVAQGLISLSNYSKLAGAITANLSQNLEPQVEVTAEQIQLAQQERLGATASDRLTTHDLAPTELTNLVQQLAHQPKIKTAYLVRKTLQYFPEKPFYVFGFVRQTGLIEAKEAEAELLNKLFTTLVFPGHTCVICLNKNHAMAKALPAIAGSAIYEKKK